MAGASAQVLQLIRAHYSADEGVFQSAALALARGSKIWNVRNEIERLVRVGTSRQQSQRQQPGHMEPRQLQQFQPQRPPEYDGLLEPLQQITFAELSLPSDLQQQFDELVIELEYREALQERGLRARDRILLHGPPGNGKTSSAIAMAAAIGETPYGVNLSGVISPYLGDTGRNLAKVFAAIRPGSLVVLDEIDALASERGKATGSGGAGKEYNTVVNTMLTLLDRNDKGVIVATTNRPDIIDPAVLRRFDEVLEIPAPTALQMQQLAERLCAGYAVPSVNCRDCLNFDQVTKRVRTEARRHVMREIRAAEQAEEDSDAEEEEREAG